MIDENTASVKTTIDDFRPVDEKISNRAGLALVAKYLSAIGITQMLADRFGFLKKSAKGAPLRSIFNQLILFFSDGTDFHLTRFDVLKRDAAYAAVIETKDQDMLSSHSVKRFFGNFSRLRVYLLRKVLQRLFLWQFQSTRP